MRIRNLGCSLATIVLLAAAFAVADDAKEKLKEPKITDEDRAHWAYQPPRRPLVPKSSATHPIDAFIREKLTAAKLSPAPPADRSTLIRRVYFDVTGLPPTPTEADAFVQDTSANAYEKVVDTLLASPHYGERFAQHWLDVVRYAETNGYELDADRPHAWRYRDYVIRSFNADKPYPIFLKEQLAGDELAAGKDPRTVPDLLIATGMHRCGPSHVVSGNLDKAALRQEYLTEMVNAIGSAVLGMTMACARCHDHKFDPISAADYYRLQAFFAAAQYRDVNLATKEEASKQAAKAAEIAARVAPLQKQVGELDAPVRVKVAAAKKAALEPKYREALDVEAKKRTPEQKQLVSDIQPVIKISWDDILDAMPAKEKGLRDQIREKIHAIQAELPAPPAMAWAITDDEKRPVTHVLKRGDTDRKGAVVLPGFPRVLLKEAVSPKNRVEFADWLATPEHPLTSRVIVNRLWHHLFGRGLVGTVNDFGTRGDKPTHPELLDWLAREMIEQPEPWSMKRMIRLMVTSETYKQASRVTLTDTAVTADPDNRLLWKMNRKRIDAEALRDAILTATGTLNRDTGGPSVRIPLESAVYDLIFTEGEPDGLWPVTTDAKQHDRRSIYLFAKRNVRLPMLEAFDQPDTLTPCNGRGVSTFAPQALILMNGPFTYEQSRKLAKSVMAVPKSTPDDWVRNIYRRCLARNPTDTEMAVAKAFLTSNGEPGVANLSLAMFNTNSFVYLP